MFDKDAMKNALKSLEGVQMQIPPAYSALSVNGVRAYSLPEKACRLICLRVEWKYIRLIWSGRLRKRFFV